jgi:osmotically inducible protein OsmC
MVRKAKAVWHGTGRAGDGRLSSDSGVLAQTPYSFKTRFENEKGTNPEELIAAAQNSPVSKMLKAEITLDARLV